MITDEIIESYLNCKYKAYRKLKEEQGFIKEFEIFQREQFVEYRTQLYNRLLEKYGTEKLLNGYKFENNRRITEENVFIHPILNTGVYQISFDAIEIIPKTKSSSNKLHIPIIVSPKEKISAAEKLSVCIKCVILSELYGINYKFCEIVHGQDLRIDKFKIEPFFPKAKKILTELNMISKGDFQPLIYHKNHCKICEFQETCEKALKKEDSLGLLYGMDEKEINKYNDKGIFTVKQLSYTFRPRKRSKRLKTKTHPYYLSLQALAIREQKVYVYDKINIPIAKTKVFIDMEGNSDGSFIYLIGILIIENSKEKMYSLWANNFNDEKEIFNEFLKIINELNDAHIFYYGKYESNVFKRIFRCNPTNKIKDLILNKSTNILAVIHSNIYFPTYSNSLKEIGKSLGFSWSEDISSGIQTIIWRKKWESSNDTKLKDILVKYNYEDCVALKRTTDFIYSIFIEKPPNDLDNKLQNIALITELKSHDEHPNYGPMDFVSEDIEVITKCAYFEYQRNKVCFRTNKNLKRIKKIKLPKKNFKYNFNKIINITSYKCPKCNGKNFIKNEKNPYTKVCFDLKISKYGIKRWIIKYSSSHYYCLSCKMNFLPNEFQKKYPLSRRRSFEKRKKIKRMNQNEKGFGHNLLSLLVYQLVVNKNSMQNVAQNFQDYFKLPMRIDDVWALKITAANYYKTTYNKIFEKIIRGDLIHADETKVKLQKDSGYVWVLTNMEDVIYFFKPNRESAFLHDLLESFNGVLVTDFYSGYDSLKCPQQKCLVHLIRDLNNVLLKNPFDEELKELVMLFGSVVRKIIDTIDRFGLSSRYMRKHKEDVKIFYTKIEEKSFSSEIAGTFRKRMIKYEKELFLFLDYDNVPWNNNNAEHAIKYFAKYRRLINGKISQQGLEAYLILLSIYQTCNYKGISFLDFLLSKKRDMDEFILKY